jgi:hypothetical protein
VNLGPITGSIISTLDAGHADAELSRLLSSLAKAIQDSTALTKETQRQALENLQFVARQVVANPATRETASVTQTVWNGLVSLLNVASDIATICTAAAPVLAAHFGFHIP